MEIQISFADLAHKGHSCNAFPLGLGLVFSYALKHFKEGPAENYASINADLFKDPSEFATYLEHKTPKIACFSNYIWNKRLNYEFARRLKKRSPGTIIIFGGPNYPLETEEQELFLKKYPDIDFYIFRDGEEPFTRLLEMLFKNDFDASSIKEEDVIIPNVHYLSKGKVVKGDLLNPLRTLDDIPSPYLLGFFDKFLQNKKWMPLMLTARGCPFKCTFCQEGDDYFNRVRRFSLERVKKELHYIAQRAANPNLFLADSNFGMYQEDPEIATEITMIQEKYGWPRYFIGINGKNNKTRVIETASIIQKGIFGNKGVLLGASIQTTDEGVLKKIKRENIKKSTYLEVVNEAKLKGANPVTEVILGLPGDTKEAHFKSISELLDTGVHVLRSHQFLMLDGSETSTRVSRQTHGLKGRYRIMPKTVNHYQLYDETFIAPEFDEVCVESSTMSFNDYLDCRLFNLTVEIFYNDGNLEELINFLKPRGISSSTLIKNIHNKIFSEPNPLAKIYDDFLRETKELWDRECELEKLLEQPEIAEQFMSGEMGNNEQLVYRAIAFFEKMDCAVQLAFEVAKEMLQQKGLYNQQEEDYLNDLLRFTLRQKTDTLSAEKASRDYFHYDFVQLMNSRFREDPFSNRLPNKVTFEFKHTESQKKLISNYLQVYGNTYYALGTILSIAANAREFYRNVEKVHEN